LFSIILLHVCFCKYIIKYVEPTRRFYIFNSGFALILYINGQEICKKMKSYNPLFKSTNKFNGKFTHYLYRDGQKMYPKMKTNIYFKN
jgi:hypothetical protein